MINIISHEVKIGSNINIFILIFILSNKYKYRYGCYSDAKNIYGYNLDTKSMGTITDISWRVQLYKYRIKDVTK